MIAFIPKKEGASFVTQFRPISLLNEIYKIVSKVLANGLNAKISLLIDVAQTTFIKDRYILGSVATTQEILSHAHLHHLEAIFIKLDFKKAFDLVSWSFLLQLLQARGFSS